MDGRKIISRDTECLDHNMSITSCKLVHPFFPSRPHYLKGEAKYIRQTFIIHHPPLAPHEIPWGELHMSDVFLVYFLIAFEYLKTAFYFINTRYQIMMRCWKNDPDARQTLTDSRNQLKPYIKWVVTDSWWCFENEGWWNWLNQRRKWFKWNITRLKPRLVRGNQLDGHKSGAFNAQLCCLVGDW